MKPEGVYLVSEHLDYRKLICADAGPGYAESMGWPVRPLRTAVNLDQVAVIDNRITQSECAWLESHIEANAGQPFVLKVVDPYTWHRASPYNRLLFRLAGRPNVRYLSVYTPTELTLELQKLAGPEKMIVIPYPYRENAEQALGRVRQRRLSVTGIPPWKEWAFYQALYPLRAAVMSASLWNPLLWGKVSRLAHPGYPDIGHHPRHTLVGGAFIRFLASSMFMLVCPSRCNLEFLKYTECAYAGCVPVGAAPASFTPEMASHILPLEPGGIAAGLRKILALPAEEVVARAVAFREVMRRERTPELLNERFSGFLAGTFARQHA